ncbi:MAG: hypothetical protein NZO16_03515 [Deltaproteobacteria bacterium]|nr:hypothetical protein [Deltaproteobacteria bacterium]
MTEKFSVYLIGRDETTPQLVERLYYNGVKAEVIDFGEKDLEGVICDTNKGLVIVESDDLDFGILNKLLDGSTPIVAYSQKVFEKLKELNLDIQILPNEGSLQMLADDIVSYFLYWKNNQKRRSTNFSELLGKPNLFSKFSINNFCVNPVQTSFLEGYMRDVSPKNLNALKRLSLISAGVMQHLHPDKATQVGFLSLVSCLAFRQNIHEFVFDRISASSLVSRLKDVAIMTSIKLKDELITESVHRIAKYFEGGNVELTELEKIFIVAKELYAVCFPRGVFRPTGSYLFLSSLSDSQDAISKAVFNFLGQILSQKTTKVWVSPRKLNKDQLARIFRFVTEPISEDECIVSLSDLHQGCTVTKPIVDFEGRKLVEEHTVLDRDIIQRLIKLACLVPIIDPVIRKT